MEAQRSPHGSSAAYAGVAADLHVEINLLAVWLLTAGIENKLEQHRTCSAPQEKHTPDNQFSAARSIACLRSELATPSCATAGELLPNS
eukprot:6178306-Pleurochrysis_carterae.AAC.5